MKRIVWAALLPWWPCLLLAQTPVVETDMVPSAEVLEFFDAAYQQHLDALQP